MIEVYLFYAMFTAQVVVFSVLYPSTMIRNVHAAVARYPVERSPLGDEQGRMWLERWLRTYRHINTGVALLGLLLLGLLRSYMQRPAWDDGDVSALLTVYFLLQFVPTALFWWELRKGNRQLKELLRREKRTASLQRRRLFDFVSPFVVGFTVLSWLVHAALAVYLDRAPFPHYAGAFVNVAISTMMCAGMAFGVYRTVYGKKSSPLLTHEDHLWEIEVTVRILVYGCMISMLALTLTLVLGKLDLPSVKPLAQSTIQVVIGAMLCAMGRKKKPRTGVAIRAVRGADVIRL
jgi:MFS family permease